MHTDRLARLMGRPVEVEALPFTARYPRRMLWWEVGKSGAGVAFCGGFIVAVNPAQAVAWILGAVGLMFGLYLVQQARRFPVRLRVHDQGITPGEDGADTLRWEAVRRFRLKFYPHGRRAESGTLVLIMADGGTRKLKVDSSLDAFPSVLAHAAEAAREHEVTLDETTEANLAQLGL